VDESPFTAGSNPSQPSTLRPDRRDSQKNVSCSASLYSGLCQTSERPSGITGVAALTLLGGGCLFLYAIVLAALGSMGHAGTYTDPAATFRFQTLAYPPLILSLLSVIAAVGIFMRSRFGWYSSILLWILSITYLLYAAYSGLPVSAPISHVLIAAVILVNILFIVYFQSEEVKSYFKMK
jgi:hypothetical protein